MAKEVERTESGRPRVPRPMPDTSDAAHCPHCGAEVGAGHYVCWNCSRDVRMRERTEEEIMTEYQWMLAREELGLEARNLRFFVLLGVSLLGIGIAWVAFRPHEWGMLVLFGLPALWAGNNARRSVRRSRRIRKAHDL